LFISKFASLCLIIVQIIVFPTVVCEDMIACYSFILRFFVSSTASGSASPST